MQNQKQVKCDGSQSEFLLFALDTNPVFVDNNPQHRKGDDRGKYVSESRQRSESTG